MSLSLVIALGSFNAGYQIGVMNSLDEIFQAKCGYADDSHKWDHVFWPIINTILTMCAAISSLFGDMLAKPLGRTKMMIVVNVITVIGAIVIQVST